MRLCSFIPNRDCCKSRLYTDQGASLPSGYKESARPRRRTLLYRVYSLSKFVIIWADIFIASILHAKALRDYAELHKAQPLIKMPRMDVRSNDCIKLQNSKSMCRALRQAIPHQLFPNVQAARISANGIAGIADMTASAYIVGVQNVQAINLSRISIRRNSTISLTRKKVFPVSAVSNSSCEKAIPFSTTSFQI